MVKMKQKMSTSGISEDKQRMAKLQAQVVGVLDAVIAKLDPDECKVSLRYKIMPAFAATVDEAGLRAVAALDEVVSIEEDRKVQLTTAQGIPQMNVGSHRSSAGGDGVGIAIVDSGIDYTHPAFSGRFVVGCDIADWDNDPMDTFGHGTSCAGIAAGNNTGQGDYMGGVAPKAGLYIFKVAPDGGKGVNIAAVMKAWEVCVEVKNANPDYPILIISNSLGSKGFTDYCDSQESAYAQFAQLVVDNGIALFVASGNEGYTNALASPACLRNTISVGAVYDATFGYYQFGNVCANSFTIQDKVACFSNSASFLDLLAPSAKAYSPTISGYDDAFSGTSAACPYAAGAAAVIQSYAKKNLGRFLSPSELRDRMVNTGDRIYDAKSGVSTPRVNVAAAINSLGGGGGGEAKWGVYNRVCCSGGSLLMFSGIIDNKIRFSMTNGCSRAATWAGYLPTSPGSGKIFSYVIQGCGVKESGSMKITANLEAGNCYVIFLYVDGGYLNMGLAKIDGCVQPSANSISGLMEGSAGGYEIMETIRLPLSEDQVDKISTCIPKLP